MASWSADPQVDVVQLVFLLESTDPDLINRITVGQQRHQTVVNVIEARNARHFELQRRAAALQAQGIMGAEDCRARPQNALCETFHREEFSRATWP